MTTQIRDMIASIVPWWLTDRNPAGPSVGYRILYAVATVVDACIEFFMQGVQARMSGLGTPTALPLIGSDRVIVRGPGDTDAEYAEKCRTWLDKHARRGSLEAIARQIHEFLAGHPKVRIVNRLGVWLTINADGSMVRELYPLVWDWDSISNPGRNTTSPTEFFVIVYPTHYPNAGVWGVNGDKFGDNGKAFGLDAPLQDIRNVRTLIDEWKSGGSLCRCVIFTYNAADFDPVAGGSLLPDGNWGKYHKISGGVVVPARPTNLRYLDHEGPL